MSNFHDRKRLLRSKHNTKTDATRIAHHTKNMRHSNITRKRKKQYSHTTKKKKEESNQKKETRPWTAKWSRKIRLTRKLSLPQTPPPNPRPISSTVAQAGPGPGVTAATPESLAWSAERRSPAGGRSGVPSKRGRKRAAPTEKQSAATRTHRRHRRVAGGVISPGGTDETAETKRPCSPPTMWERSSFWERRKIQ